MKSIYSKSRKLILVIFLGLYYYTIEKFTIFILTDIVTTILLSSILLPIATSKYINISNIDNNNIKTNNIINNTNIDFLNSLFTNNVINENSTTIEQYHKNDTIKKKYDLIKNRKNRNSSRYKRWWWTNDNSKSLTALRNNDFIIKNESTTELMTALKTSDNNNNLNSDMKNQKTNNNNYYYEEQKPLIIIPSESGPISIKDYTGSGKSVLKQSDTMNTDNGSDDFERYNNNFYDNNEYDSRSKYIVTTSTVSPSGISDLSSKEMNEYDDNYRNDDDNTDDYDRQKYNDEIENNDNDNNSYDDEQPNNISSYMETAKKVWDIFTAINAAWSAISDKQQTDNDNRNSRKFHENEIESTTSYDQQTKNYETSYSVDEEAERLKRNTNYTNGNFYYKSIESDINTDMNTDMNTDIHSSTDVAIAEGRYIKGDPLKGYYDFVITEGSYKFWAAFQFATAILIIYSTFAAIYYSKVNPLVGDYDYVDYLGGGRSLSNNNDDDDTDFIDIPYSESQPKSSLSKDNNNNINSKSFLSTIVETASNSGSDLIPRMGYTLKFILDAIDKIPQ